MSVARENIKAVSANKNSLTACRLGSLFQAISEAFLNTVIGKKTTAYTRTTANILAPTINRGLFSFIFIVPISYKKRVGEIGI